MNVAFIGLGVMGYPMAGHLQRQGHRVRVYNRTPAKALQWSAEYAGDCADTPRQAAQGAELVMCCVGNDEDLRQVLLGEQGAFAGMSPCWLITPPLRLTWRGSWRYRQPSVNWGSLMPRCQAARREQSMAS